MKTTLIECFGQSHLENITASLIFKPDRVIFLHTEYSIKDHTDKYTDFFRNRELNAVISARKFTHSNTEKLLEDLSNLVNNEEDFIFDITGGNELLLFSVGALLERFKNAKNFRVVKLDINAETVNDLTAQTFYKFPSDVYLDIECLISLHGGKIVNDNQQPLKEDSLSKITPIWEMSCKNPKKWNKNVGILKEFEKRSSNHPESLWIDVKPENASNIVSHNEKKDELRKFLISLTKLGIIDSIYTGQDRLGYRYKNKFFKDCFQKAGDVLELKCYFEARELTVDGKIFFNSCYVGANIDWDGIVSSNSRQSYDTRNEIDLILIHSMTPIFISCKNGKIDEEELYKLNTVANRFGGKYAKKMLIATQFERDSKFSSDAFQQRARDMDIKFIDNAASLSANDWKNMFTNVLKPDGNF